MAKYLEGVFKRNPDQPEAKLIRAQMLVAQNKMDEAAAELEDITKSRPELPFPKYLLGVVCLRKGDVNRAGELLRSVVATVPNFREAVVALAEVDLRSGSQNVAAQSLLKLLDKPSGRRQEYLLLAEAAKTPETVRAATKLFEQVNLQFKEDPDFQLALSSLYIRQDKLTEASEILNGVLTKKPGLRAAHLLYGDLLAKQKKAAQAEQEYRKAMGLAAGPSMASLKLAELLNPTNKEESRRILDESISKWPSFLPAMMLRAQMDFNEGNTDQALKSIDEILQKNGSYTEARLLRAQIRMSQQKTAEATEDLKEAVKSSPGPVPCPFDAGGRLCSGRRCREREGRTSRGTEA